MSLLHKSDSLKANPGRQYIYKSFILTFVRVRHNRQAYLVVIELSELIVSLQKGYFTAIRFPW